MPIDGGLNRIIQDHLPMVHWQRIEPSLSIGAGVADLNGCYRGVEFWIELKQTKGYAVNVRPSQVAFAERRTRYGGKVWLACRRQCAEGKRRIACDELWLLKTPAIRMLCHVGLDELPGEVVAAHDLGGPANWGWPEILNIFTGAQ